MPEPPEEDDALYVVVPSEFVAARDALARRVRAAGDKAEAARVAKLRRPTPAAWALNQVARSRPPLVADLLAAGDRLRLATERAVGGDASGLRAARAAERAAVDTIMRDAMSRLGAAATEANRLRLAATLRAAIVDPPVAERLRQGRLSTDHDEPGFGMDAFVAPVGEAGREDEAPLPAGAGAGAEAGAGAGRLPSEARRRSAEAGPLPAGADRLSAEASPVDVDRPSAEASPVDVDRPSAEASPVDVDRLSAEASRAAAEADRLAEQAQRLASEAARAAQLANEADARAADARARAAEADGRAADARIRSDEAAARAADAAEKAAEAAARAAEASEKAAEAAARAAEAV